MGYRCSIPLSTYERLSDTGRYRFSYTPIIERTASAVGFFSQRSAIFSPFSSGLRGLGRRWRFQYFGDYPEDLVRAVRSGDLAPLMRVPGIGRSKAEKLVFELGRRLKNIEVVSNEAGVKQSARNEAIEALAALGFDEGRAARAVDELLRADPSLPIEPLVKAALKSVSS